MASNSVSQTISEKNSEFQLGDSGKDNLQESETVEMACSFDSTKNLTSNGIHITKYILQKEKWPKEGRHIVAQYDDKSVIVYQAFKPTIAKYAVQHQK